MTVDLRTEYLGLSLENPLVAAASPLTSRVDELEALQEAGVGAVVLPSLFEEQVEESGVIADAGARYPSGDLLAGVPLDAYNTGPWGYLELLRAARERLEIPVIASVNAGGVGPWVQHVRLLEEVGADALELNVYQPECDVRVTGLAVERRLIALVEQVRATVRIPLAVKLGPYFSSLPGLARRLATAGADGLVLFNRYLEPDIDLQRMEVVPRLSLSTPGELRVPLRWIGILCGKVELQLAAVSGVHAPQDVVKYLLAGADVIQTASALLRHGPGHVTILRQGLERWLDERGYASAAEARGLLCRSRCPDPGAYERINYLRTISSWQD